MGVASVELDDEGRSLWRLVIEAWDDQARHDRFVHHCFTVGRLAAAARCYRDRGVSQDGGGGGGAGGEIARKMQARIVFLATQALVPSRPAPRSLARSPWFLAIVAVGALIGAALGMLYGRR